jgi:hypothetical protein
MPPRTDVRSTPTARDSSARFDFFFYGTLCDADVLEVVLGRAVKTAPATLENYVAVPVDHGRYPMLQFQRGRVAVGTFCAGLGLFDAARLDFYENDGPAYDARQLPVRDETGAMRPAWVYFSKTPLRRGMGRWALAEWQRFAKRDYLARVARAMRKVEAKDLEPFVDLWRGRAAPNA